MKIGISNMVCPRCIEAVEGIMTEIGLPESHVELGTVELEKRLNEDQLSELQEKLKNRGFELIFDRETELVNMVKAALIKYVDHLERENTSEKLSVFVSNKTHFNYSYLSKVFSDHTGKTIETYLIELKIERVKELLGFKKYTLSEIAWKLKYSSVQYLSNQFKKITGKTVTEYLKDQKKERKTIDTI